jgi:hypothetical protein
MEKTETKQKLRDDLTPEQRKKAERIGSIEFKSAGANFLALVHHCPSVALEASPRPITN